MAKILQESSRTSGIVVADIGVWVQHEFLFEKGGGARSSFGLL